MGHNKKMDVVADLISDEAVEFDQHRDNFSMEPSHYIEYYQTAHPNFAYPG